MIQIGVVLVNLVRAKVLSLMLGPAGFGIFSTVDQVVVTVVNLASLSLSFTAMKFMARAHSDGHEQFRRAFAAFFRALSTLALGAVAVATMILVVRPDVFGGDLVPY